MGKILSTHYKTLIKNELMKEIIVIRIDTLWKMIALHEKGLLPGIYDEGATGEYDNKGAIFIPGGLIFEDSDKNMIKKKKVPMSREDVFKDIIRDAMKCDNATLLFKDGIASGINLDNGFFAEISSNIIINKAMATKRSSSLKTNPPARFSSHHITHSNVPGYIKPPYGSRTKLSSCIAVCLIEPRMYFIQCRASFGLRDKMEELEVWNNILNALQPVKSHKTVIFSPNIVVCHATRYKENNIVGITRILGYGKFGEFSTITFERVTPELITELKKQDKKIEGNVLVKYKNNKIVCILRMYVPTKPGKRHNKFYSYILNMKKDFGLPISEINMECKEKYYLS